MQILGCLCLVGNGGMGWLFIMVIDYYGSFPHSLLSLLSTRKNKRNHLKSSFIYIYTHIYIYTSNISIASWIWSTMGFLGYPIFRAEGGGSNPGQLRIFTSVHLESRPGWWICSSWSAASNHSLDPGCFFSSMLDSFIFTGNGTLLPDWTVKYKLLSSVWYPKMFWSVSSDHPVHMSTTKAEPTWTNYSYRCVIRKCHISNMFHITDISPWDRQIMRWHNRCEALGFVWKRIDVGWFSRKCADKPSWRTTSGTLSHHPTGLFMIGTSYEPI